MTSSDSVETMMMKTTTSSMVKDVKSLMSDYCHRLSPFTDDDDTPSGLSAGNNANDSDGEDDDETDYTGLGLLSGDVFEDLLGDDDDQSEEPAKKSSKKKNKGSVKQPEDSLTENEVDGTLTNSATSNDDDDDDTEEEEESGGFLELLDG